LKNLNDLPVGLYFYFIFCNEIAVSGFGMWLWHGFYLILILLICWFKTSIVTLLTYCYIEEKIWQRVILSYSSLKKKKKTSKTGFIGQVRLIPVFWVGYKL